MGAEVRDVKLFPAAGWFAVYAVPRQPYRLVVPVLFWVLDGATVRSIVPLSTGGDGDGSGPGRALAWGDHLAEGTLVGYYHAEYTPKTHIQQLVEEALVEGARQATAPNGREAE